MGPTLTAETRSLLASVRATLKELAEEGVEQFDRRGGAAIESPPRLDAAALQEPERDSARSYLG